MRKALTIAAVAAVAAFGGSSLAGRAAAFGQTSILPTAYQVADMHFTPSPAEPSRLSEISFRVTSGDPRSAAVRLDDRGVWHRCGVRAGHAVCPIVPAAPIGPLDGVEVVVTG